MKKLLEKIPQLPNGSLPVYDCNNGVYMFLFREKTKQDMDEYVALALNEGFNVFDSTDLGSNYYTTLIKEGLCLHVYFTDVDSSLRIVIDEKTQLYNPKPQKIEESCKTSLWQFEVDHSLIDCGMCYIIRCCDNSFFIVDSAHTYSVNDNDRIYKFLKDQTPAGEKIRIAGWFFSHGHVDHIGKFCDFLRYNSDDVEIEVLYYNFVSFSHRDSANWSEADLNFQRNFEKLVEGHSKIKKIKLHSGQRFFVKNLEFRVLCTHEDVYPDSLENYNDSSTMIMMYAKGTSVMFPGDAGFVESDIVTSRFGKLLKCDIMQAAHHGHFGTKKDFYELADAGVILFPTTQIKYDEDFEVREINRWAVSNADECYIASNGTMQFDLPYEKGTAIHFDDETIEDFDGVYNLWGYEYTQQRKDQLKEQFVANGGKL